MGLEFKWIFVAPGDFFSPGDDFSKHMKRPGESYKYDFINYTDKRSTSLKFLIFLNLENIK